VKKVRTLGILIGRKPLKINHVLTEEKPDDTGSRLENSQKSLRQLALQSGISVGSEWTATKLLHIRPHKITDPKPTFFIDEANFNFSLKKQQVLE
jgi:hypothetical protein